MISPPSFSTGSLTSIEENHGVSYTGDDMCVNANDAFSDAYDTHADAIFRHCYFHTFDSEQAKNLLQETFIKTWEYIAAGNQIENIRAFLYKVATNLTINDARRKKSVSLEAMQEEGFDPGKNDESIGRDWVTEKQAITALQAIAEPYRCAVTLRYIEGFYPQEIAEIVGVSASVISVRIHRGLKQLRIALQSKKKNLDFVSVESNVPSRFEIKTLPLSLPIC